MRRSCSSASWFSAAREIPRGPRSLRDHPWPKKKPPEWIIRIRRSISSGFLSFWKSAWLPMVSIVPLALLWNPAVSHWCLAPSQWMTCAEEKPGKNKSVKKSICQLAATIGCDQVHWSLFLIYCQSHSVSNSKEEMLPYIDYIIVHKFTFLWFMVFTRSCYVPSSDWISSQPKKMLWEQLPRQY